MHHCWMYLFCGTSDKTSQLQHVSLTEREPQGNKKGTSTKAQPSKNAAAFLKDPTALPKDAILTIHIIYICVHAVRYLDGVVKEKRRKEKRRREKKERKKSLFQNT